MNKDKAEPILRALRDKSHGAFAPVLGVLGFSAAEIDAANKGKVHEAFHRSENLDEDPALEEMLQVQVRDPRHEDEASTTPEVVHHFIAFLDRGPQGVTVAGRIARSIRICLTGTPPEVTLAPTHAAGYSDILVSWVDGPECNGNFRGVAGDQLLTMARGKLEVLFEHQAAFENDRQSLNPIVPLVQMKPEGAPPKKLVLIDTKDKVRKRLAFDPARFVYR